MREGILTVKRREDTIANLTAYVDREDTNRRAESGGISDLRRRSWKCSSIEDEEEQNSCAMASLLVPVCVRLICPLLLLFVTHNDYILYQQSMPCIWSKLILSEPPHKKFPNYYNHKPITNLLLTYHNPVIVLLLCSRSPAIADNSNN